MEQRRTRRFTLQLPLAVTRTGAEKVTQHGLTRNISSGGVLFTAEKSPDVGGLIEYVITLSSQSHPSVNLRCIGKVLRSEKVASEINEGVYSFAIAATLERYEFLRSDN